METHRAMAAARRLASPSLRHAEACACSAVSTVDRDVSPFYHRADIWGARPAYEHISGKHPRDRLVGAVVTFHGVPGMTTESLQRVIDCHLARNDALGNDVPEMPYCPLVPSGVTAQVRTVPGGAFAVSLESRDPKTAKEILRRARALERQ